MCIFYLSSSSCFTGCSRRRLTLSKANSMLFRLGLCHCVIEVLFLENKFFPEVIMIFGFVSPHSNLLFLEIVFALSLPEISVVLGWRRSR